MNETGLWDALLGEIHPKFHSRLVYSDLTLAAIVPVPIILSRVLARESRLDNAELLRQASEIGLNGVLEPRGSGIGITARAVDLAYQDYRNRRYASHSA